MTGCIDENTVAELFRGTLAADETEALHRHLAGCDSCRQLVSTVANASWAQRAAALAPAPAPAHERHGRIGRYLLIDYLGAGGMGIVYAAYDTHLDRRVALKLLRPRAGDGSAHLQREAQAMARISHPNVAQVYDAAEIDGELVVALELVEGVTLRAWLSQPRRAAEILDCLCAAGDGLAAVHQAGIVHGDFKPDNVLVGHDGRVRVTDFGLARVHATPPATAPSDDDAAVAPGSLAGAGTPGYAAPEVLASAAADARSDQFSFCVTLREAFAGLPDARRSSPALREVLARGLSADPEARFPSLAEALARLRAEPRLRRRRLGLTWAAAALLLAGLGATLATLRPRLACRDVAAPLDRLWNGPRRAALSAAFTAAHPTLARTVLPALLAAIDAHGAGWRSARNEACRAEMRGEPPELATARRQCLAEDLAETAALLDELGHADRGAVERALEAVAAVDEPERCGDARVLRHPARLPAGPAARAQAYAVRLELARARGVAAAGQLQPAAELARAAAVAAHPLGAPAVEAEALCQAAEAEEQLTHYSTARATALEALALAEGADHDAVATRAWRLLAQLDGVRAARFTDGHAWARLAEARLGHLAGADRQRIDLLATESAILALESRLPEAIERLEQALVLARAHGGPASALVGQLLARQARLLLDAERLEEAVAPARRALAIAQTLYGDAHPDVAAAEQILAWAELRRGHLEAARDRYQDALATATVVYGRDHLVLAHLREEQALVLMYLGHCDRAVDELREVQRAQRLGLPADDLELAGSWNLLGQALSKLHRYDEALAALRRSKAIFGQRLGEQHPRYAIALATEAEVLLWLGHGGAAESLAARAIAIHRDSSGEASDELAMDFALLGEIRLYSGNAAGAVQALERSQRRGFGTHDVDQLAEDRFLLARALWNSGGSRGQARALAREASLGYARSGPRSRARRDAVDRWLSRHDARP